MKHNFLYAIVLLSHITIIFKGSFGNFENIMKFFFPISYGKILVP